MNAQLGQIVARLELAERELVTLRLRAEERELRELERRRRNRQVMSTWGPVLLSSAVALVLALAGARK